MEETDLHKTPPTPAEAGETPRLEVIEISKSFPGVRALQGVRLRVMPGEVLAVIGENGAGKSTLMKILAGAERPDAGELVLEGEPVEFASSREAIDAGIALIHQELNLAENLSVAENVFLGREPVRCCGWIDRQAIHQRAGEQLRRVGLDIDPATPLAELSLAGCQLVEIAKALSAGARLVIMDEPTSSLSEREAQRLFAVVRSLRDAGVSVVYISHRLGEVRQLADRVEILRDGRNAGQLTGAAITHDAMVRGMVGRDLAQFFPHTSHPTGATRLEVRGLRVETAPQAIVDLEVRAGEVVALAGLVGAGRSELLETLFGVRPPLAGSVQVDGRPVTIRTARDAIAAGLALVPEDRKGSGLVLEMRVLENMTLARLADAPAAPLIQPAWERQQTARMIERLGVRTASAKTVIANLSGGNQQKVAIGKWLLGDPGVLLLDEPTRGVDIGAKQEIYGIIESLAQRGAAILFASSEMEEVLGMADRVLVMHEGRITGSLARAELSEEAIMKLAVA